MYLFNRFDWRLIVMVLIDQILCFIILIKTDYSLHLTTDTTNYSRWRLITQDRENHNQL